MRAGPGQGRGLALKEQRAQRQGLRPGRSLSWAGGGAKKGAKNCGRFGEGGREGGKGGGGDEEEERMEEE